MLRTLFAPLTLALFTLGTAHGAGPERLSIDHDDARIEARCRGDAAHPLIVLLHGLGGYERFAASYDAYADLLAGAGWRACAVLYYSGDDAAVMTKSDQATRDAHRERRFGVWAGAVAKAVDELSDGHDAGVLGFSQGGYLAVAVAGRQPKVRAVAEFYGGIPRWGAPKIERLPPTLILHGEADAVVPVAQADALAAFVRERSGEVTIRRYAGADHGFDFDWSSAPAVDARQRVVAFFGRQLELNAR